MRMSKKQKFHKLTPINDAEIGIYNEALDYIFEDDDLRNVAISGAYGSGKSSILESYKINRPDKEFLHVSLAHFTPSAEMNHANSKAEVSSEAGENELGNGDSSYYKNGIEPEQIKEAALEGKIINQLIHQIPADKIPQTNFRIKKKVSDRQLALKVGGIIIFTISLLHLLLLQNWIRFLRGIDFEWAKEELELFMTVIAPILSGLVLVTFVSFGLYHILRTQSNRWFVKKVGTDKFAIEIFEEADDSYFDKYLNEVLYLFEQCEADAIVFEDMDRFNSNQIFVRLQEVNKLLNSRRKRRGRREKDKKKENKEKVVRFIYLLRDDAFMSKERTKFFDFIIPVVPVVDGSNSYDQFIEHLRDDGVFELFDQTFLQGFSLYVDDMRILKNICNEFLIYNSRINTIELDVNKLMAIIAYKNVFPRDFDELQLNRGFVYTLFKKKAQFVKDEIVKLETELVRKKEKIIYAENELLEAKEELDIIIAFRKNELKQVQYKLRVERENELDEIEARRAEAIEHKSNEKKSFLLEEITQLEKAIEALSSKPLKSIIGPANIDTIFAVKSENDIGIVSYFEDVRGNTYFDLLKYLIRNGYIDESYEDYMTYFYEHSLKKADKMFLRSITDQVGKEYNYKLQSPEKVLERLPESAFKQPEILNYDLLFYMLSKYAIDRFTKEKTVEWTRDFPVFLNAKEGKGKAQRCLAIMMDQILDEAGKKHFLKRVCTDVKDEQLNYLVGFINSEWLERLIEPSSWTEFNWICLSRLERIINSDYILRTLCIMTHEKFESDNYFKEILREYLLRSSHFLKEDNFEEERLKKMFGDNVEQERVLNLCIERFSLLGLEFENIDANTTIPELFDAIYEGNLYRLSFANIVHLLEVKYSLKRTEDFKHKNYTLIQTQTDTPLAKYVEANINDYIKEVLANCDKNITDDEEDALLLLNNEDVFAEHKTAYINVLTTVIRELSSVSEKSLWKDLLVASCIKHTEKNILDYFVHCESEITAELIAFINSAQRMYEFSEIRVQYDEEIQGDFFDAVIRCSELKNTNYVMILSTLEWYYEDDFYIERIPIDKMDILIENRIIRMSENNLIYMREHYPSNLIRYITVNIEDYYDLVMENDLFDGEEVFGLLAEEVSDDFKIRLLENIEDEFTANNKDYSDVIKAHILLNNFIESDLEYFVENYNEEGTETKAAIVTLLLRWLKQNFTEPLPMPAELLDDVVKAADVLTHEDKLALLLCVISKIDEQQVKDYLVQFELDVFLSLFNQKRPKILSNEVNTQLLDIFEQNGWITKYEVDINDSSYYRAYGRKVIKQEITRHN